MVTQVENGCNVYDEGGFLQAVRLGKMVEHCNGCHAQYDCPFVRYGPPVAPPVRPRTKIITVGPCAQCPEGMTCEYCIHDPTENEVLVPVDIPITFRERVFLQYTTEDMEDWQ